jgi:hypothetical protein
MPPVLPSPLALLSQSFLPPFPSSYLFPLLSRPWPPSSCLPSSRSSPPPLPPPAPQGLKHTELTKRTGMSASPAYAPRMTPRITGVIITCIVHMQGT